MSLSRFWKSYWFRPSAVLPLAVTGIILVGVQLLLLVFSSAYDAQHLVRLPRLPDHLYDPLPILKLIILPLGWDFRPPLAILLLIYGATLATGLASFVGFKTNASLLLFAVGNIFLQGFSYSFGDFHHPETVMIIALCCLAVSPAGRVLSVDDLQRRVRQDIEHGSLVSADISERKSAFANWPLLLIQWFLAIVYFDAALSKLYRSGFDWMNGHTLQYYLFQDGLARGGDIGVWLAQQHTVAWLLSWVTLIFEGTFFLILIFPILGWLYLPGGVALHLGMCVSRIACFYQFVAAYCAFVPWGRVFQRCRRPEAEIGRAELRVRYSSESQPSMRTVTVLQYFDWLDLLRFVPEKYKPNDGPENRAGSEHAGRALHRKSVRRILWRVPVLWPALLLSCLPGAPRLIGSFFRQIEIGGHAAS